MFQLLNMMSALVGKDNDDYDDDDGSCGGGGDSGGGDGNRNTSKPHICKQFLFILFNEMGDTMNQYWNLHCFNVGRSIAIHHWQIKWSRNTSVSTNK